MTTYRVTVGEKEYQVEIEDLNAQPVQAMVNGHEVQVWVEERRPAAPSASPPPGAAPSVPVTAPVSATPQPGGATCKEVRAPMPGTVTEIVVQPGEQVTTGQDLLVLDAMKMKNRIRSPRAGRIERVDVNPGQQVQHGDVLLCFEG
jgi:biotin carboxyl carrier protein